MTEFLRMWGMDSTLLHILQTLSAEVLNLGFLAQCLAIAVAGGIAFALGAKIRAPLAQRLNALLPNRWTSALMKGSQFVVWPLIWLVLLWLSQIGVRLSGHTAPLVAAGIELLAAWVCIRLLSLSVRSSIASVTISVVVWAIAALSILGLLDVVIDELAASAIRLGKYQLSALTVIHVVIALSVLLWLTMQIFRFLSRQIEHASSLTPSLRVLFIQLLQILLPALAIIVALSAAGVDLTALTVISGAVFLGIGLGLQKLVGNLVAGLTILVGKSIKPGDIIAYKDGLGQVTEMGARYVTVRRLNGVEDLVPNEYFLDNGVENWTHTNSRVWLNVEVGISYDSDPREGVRLCAEAAKAVKRVADDPPPFCAVKEFGDSSVNLIVYFCIGDPENGTVSVKSEILLGIWDRFREAGITIPYPQRDVHIIPPAAPSATPTEARVTGPGTPPDPPHIDHAPA